MAITVRDKFAILNRLVFEVRYPYGQVYLDRCGQILKEITTKLPEWAILGNVSPQGAPLVSMRNRCVLNFSSAKYDLSLEQRTGQLGITSDQMTEFTEQATEVTSVLHERMDLEEFSRVGLRAWFLFANKSRIDAEEWLRTLGVYTVSKRLVQAFGTEIEALGVSVVVVGSDRKFRVAFNGVESGETLDFGGKSSLNIKPSALPKKQKEYLLQREKERRRAKDNPRYAAMIDIDAFQDDPAMVDVKHYILTSYETMTTALMDATRKQSK